MSIATLIDPHREHPLGQQSPARRPKPLAVRRSGRESAPEYVPLAKTTFPRIYHAPHTTHTMSPVVRTP
jgi:hypothetical protein